MPDYESHHTMDELIIKTVGLMETLPDRITQLEKSVRDIEKKFAHHEGTQEQGIKRTSDTFNTVNQCIENVKKDFDECRKDKPPVTILKDLKSIQSKIEDIEKIINPIVKDFKEREDSKKDIKKYIKEIILAFIRYAMLPMTIAILILLGMNPKYIPWYKSPTSQKDSGEKLNHDRQSSNNDK